MKFDYTGIIMPGVEMIAEERQAHFTREGWTAEGDARHRKSELARAAVAYVLACFQRYPGVPRYWPWDRQWWKPASDIRMLVKAGALIAAEIDRRLAIKENENVNA